MNINQLIRYFNRRGISVTRDGNSNTFYSQSEGISGQLFLPQKHILLNLSNEIPVDLEERLKHVEKDLKQTEITIMIYDPLQFKAKKIIDYNFKK